MSAETTSLVLAVDSSQVKSAADVLGKFAQAGKTAEASSDALEKANAKAALANARLEEATRKLATAQSALKTATEKTSATQEAIALATGKAATAQSALTLAQMTAKTAQEGAAKAAQSHAASLATIGKQSALSASQAQQLSYQLNDFFVQVSSGQGFSRRSFSRARNSPARSAASVAPCARSGACLRSGALPSVALLARSSQPGTR
jgi:membrane protein involved in colicin uptake